MSKGFTYLFFSGLLVAVIAAWGVDRFIFPFLPPEFDNLWVMILSVLGAVTAISGAIKAIQHIGELFFPTRPEPGEEEKLLAKLRELTWAISEDSAREYTNKILGDRSCDFWEKITKNDQNANLLATLVSDPFMLEGLICVYRDQNGLLPKNTGALLDKLIRTQWTRKKIKVEHWMGLDDLLAAFGWLVIKGIPQVKYPVKKSEEGMPRRWRGWYVQMLMDIGYWMHWRRDERRSRNRLATRIVLIPIRLLLALLEIIWDFIILMPINYINRLIRNQLLKSGKYYGLYEDFLAGYNNLIDSLRVRPRILVRDANYLLLAAEKAHIIKRGDDFFTFRHKSWMDYFAAYYVVQSPSVISTLEENDTFNKGWRRLAPERAGIAICVSGMLKSPEQFHRDLLRKDPFLLVQCILSGIDFQGEFYATIADELKRVILDVRDAGEWRSVDFSRILQQFRYDPTDTLTILEAIVQINNEAVNFELARLIANYGRDVVDILISRLNNASGKEKRFIILILAWIGDPRSALALRGLPNVVDEDDMFNTVQQTCVTVLTVCFGDAAASAELHAHLFQKDERDYYWSVLGKIGEKALLWASQLISSWRDLYPDKLYIIKREFLNLCGKVGNSEKIRDALAQHLRDKNDLAFTHLYIESLGRIKAIEEKDFLMEQLNAVDDNSCLYAIEALGNLGYAAAIPSLKQKLFHRNEQVKEMAKDVIEKLSRNSTEKSVDY